MQFGTSISSGRSITSGGSKCWAGVEHIRGQLPASFEPFKNNRNFRVIKNYQSAHFAAEHILLARPFHVDCQSKRGAQICTKINHAMIGQQACRTIFQCDPHIARQFRRAKCCVTRTVDRISTRCRNHVVNSLNILAQAGRRSCMRRTRFDHRLRFSSGGKKIKMHALYRRWQIFTLITGVRIRFNEIALRHRCVRVPLAVIAYHKTNKPYPAAGLHGHSNRFPQNLERKIYEKNGHDDWNSTRGYS